MPLAIGLHANHDPKACADDGHEANNKEHNKAHEVSKEREECDDGHDCGHDHANGQKVIDHLVALFRLSLAGALVRLFACN